MNRFETTWLEQIRRRDDGVRNARVLVACSGGGDSMALLAFLWCVRRSLGLELAVAHIDHSLRPDSTADAQFVSDWVRALDLDYVEARLDVRAHAQATRQGLETAARELRWRWLRNEAESIGADVIATGHSLDDHTETVLMRLARGGGAGALIPLPARQENRWSPLIQVPRSELRAYLQQKHIPWQEDATNAEDFTPRNRWRKLLESIRAEASTLDVHLWETHRQIEELTAFRDAQVEAWQGTRWEVQADHIILHGTWQEPELRMVLEAAFRRLDWPREADHLRDLAHWMQQSMHQKPRKSRTWGHWHLEPKPEAGPEAWQLRQHQPSSLALRRAIEAESSAIIYEEATQAMLAKGILQWDARYPNLDSAHQALERQDLHVIRDSSTRQVVGTVILNVHPNPGYETISWTGPEPALVIHTLALSPSVQGRGLGRQTMALIEAWAKTRGYRSLRLDTYPGNVAAMALYASMGFVPRGFIRFEGIKPPGHETYQVMEKTL